MSRKEGVLLASRVLAIYFVCWALDALSHLPASLFAFVHHASRSSIVPTENYFRSYDLISISFLFLRVLALLTAAIWFYKCGEKVESFFFPAHETANSE